MDRVLTSACQYIVVDRVLETVAVLAYQEQMETVYVRGDSGNCQFDCEALWYGEHCNTSCSSNCDAHLCERGGNCSIGCIVRHYGPMCQTSCLSTCTDETCDRVKHVEHAQHVTNQPITRYLSVELLVSISMYNRVLKNPYFA